MLLIDVPDLFDREQIYGDGADYPDSPRRFAVLARAALEWCAGTGSRPSVVHAHDWQGGLAPVYLKTLYAAHPVLGGVPSVFTIHNLAYQGLAEPDWLPRLDLPWSLFAIDGMEFWGRISLLKGGINAADRVTTVSPTYAREIQTAGVRLRIRRHSPPARRRSRRHPQRHRHRSVEPGHRSAHSAAVQRRRSRRQARREAGRAGTLRPENRLVRDGHVAAA